MAHPTRRRHRPPRALVLVVAVALGAGWVSRTRSRAMARNLAEFHERYGST
ncbi:hypothetical protein [Rhabdothermincola salaria]|uniref:hypothetical protein n=1 Tax=Rhabdothermincola salaria TaxID=2903142 RepID=UPI001E572E26|nr:hypothetical protein [Rhabdothermincola salaria]MCD9622561.1 hypothetical protein [Rhabdothermincola salaria]